MVEWTSCHLVICPYVTCSSCFHIARNISVETLHVCLMPHSALAMQISTMCRCTCLIFDQYCEIYVSLNNLCTLATEQVITGLHIPPLTKNLPWRNVRVKINLCFRLHLMTAAHEKCCVLHLCQVPSSQAQQYKNATQVCKPIRAVHRIHSQKLGPFTHQHCWLPWQCVPLHLFLALAHCFSFVLSGKKRKRG